jgi:hypothetical protein
MRQKRKNGTQTKNEGIEPNGFSQNQIMGPSAIGWGTWLLEWAD